MTILLPSLRTLGLQTYIQLPSDGLPRTSVPFFILCHSKQSARPLGEVVLLYGSQQVHEIEGIREENWQFGPGLPPDAHSHAIIPG